MSSEQFWRRFEQRRNESLPQFINIVQPEQAAHFVDAMHGVAQKLHDDKIDTMLIAQRGGVPFDWAIRQVDNIVGRKSPRTIYLPIGTQHDIATVNGKQLPGIEEKKGIAQLIFEATSGTRGYGNTAFVEEAKSGTSVSTFLQHVHPLLPSHTDFEVLAVIDPRSSLGKDQAPLRAMAEQYRIPIFGVKAPLIFSDKGSFVDELTLDRARPKGRVVVPHTIHNPEMRAISDLLVLGGFYPQELRQFADGKYAYSPVMQEIKGKFDIATHNLTQPEYFLPWLKEYARLRA